MGLTIKSNKGLPKTGQVVSYQDYDDGFYKKGYPLADTIERFVDNGNNTITDNLLNVMWIKQVELIIPGDNGTIGTVSSEWASSTSYAVGDLVYVNADNKAWFSSGTSYPYPGSHARFRCQSAHTSGNFQTDFGNSKWLFECFRNDLNCVNSALSSWTNDFVYKKGNYVSGSDGSNTYAWICAVDHTSVNSSGIAWDVDQNYVVGDIRQDQSGSPYTGWRCINNHTSKTFTTYTDTTSYNQNDVVYNGSYYYRCMNGHTSDGATLSDDEVNNPLAWALLNPSNASSLSSIFAFDRQLNTSNWVQVYTGTDFAHVLIDHPTYWIKTPFLSTSGSYPIGYSNSDIQSLSWSDAISAIHNLNYIGKSDWRMPNFFELISLFNAANASNSDNHPAVENIFPAINTGNYYWTSTTQNTSTSNAYIVEFQNSQIYVTTTGKGSSYYLMICRDL